MTSPAGRAAPVTTTENDAPSTLQHCDATLPLDDQPQIVRLTQFILFADPKADLQSPDPPKYLILQQYQTQPGGHGHGHKPGVNQLIGALAGALTGPSTAPTPARRATAKRASTRSTGAAATSARAEGASAPVTPSASAILATLRRAGFAVDRTGTSGSNDQETVATALGHVFLPDPYEPFADPHPHIALMVTLEQVWEAQGYTRGELITTIGLAPGEQLTLELHSWDKTTYKSQDELMTESELRLAQTSNQRDSLTVARETASQTSMSLNVGATIPIKAVSVTLGGGASNQVSSSIHSTVEQTQQHTADAAFTLKSTRKLNIEVSRETGREQKQTRVIANTNRCHTLSCHYFEIMSNYRVTTRLASLQPCLLVTTPRADITPAWVLCHEAILKRALVDDVYLAGFDGARTLESESAYIEIQKIRGAVPPEFEPELKDLLGSITDAYSELQTNFETVLHLAEYASMFFGSGGVLAVITYVAGAVHDLMKLRQFLYWVALAGNRPLWRALERLNKEAAHATKPSYPLRAFFTIVKPNDFDVTPSASSVAKGAAALGVPSSLIDGLIAWGFLDLVPDDGGMSETIKAVAKRLEEIWSLPSGQGTGSTPAAGFSDVDVATAHANFDQLRCHIDDNWLHYAKAMWMDEDADERFLRLQAYGAIAGVLGNEVLGFLGHKEAFAVAAPAAITAVDLQSLIDQVRQQLKNDVPAPTIVSLPTAGSVLESIVGQCDGCEDYIRQSRVVDLRAQHAKALQEEQEARRRKMRLDQDPPDLSDPEATAAGGRVVINVEPDGTPTSTGPAPA